jgi:uncharacterized delta-60 repeat protein
MKNLISKWKNILWLAAIVISFSASHAAYAADGDKDTSFLEGIVPGTNGGIATTSIQSDGKIVIAGGFTSYNNTSINRIARLNTDGTLDATFNPGISTGDDGYIHASAIQSNGKIVIGGSFWSYDNASRGCITRLNANGTLDTTFNSEVGADTYVRAIAIQSDGKILIGGDFTTYNGTSRNYIARLNADGTLDTTFNPGMGADSSVRNIAIQSDGKIVIGGEFTTYNGTSRNYIARLNADGTLDTTFNPGVGANNSVYTTVIQSDGKILIGGWFDTYNNTSRNHIARLNTDGTLDTAFDTEIGASDPIYTIAIQSDGKIIIGGVFITYDGEFKNRITRLNIDGTLDAGFNAGGMGINNFAYTAAIQSDGKIIIGGEFTTYNDTNRSYIARLNTDGTLDNAFNPGAGANSYIYITALQSDGKIIIGGNFTTYNGTSRNYIARLNADGTLDTTFNPGMGADSSVRNIAIQSDGKIVIGGEFTTYNGTSRNYIARLNADGTLDTTFNPGTGANGTVNSAAIQSDGRIIIGGSFTTYNGTARSRIARLNTDGTLDTTFNPGSGANNYVFTTTIQSSGKIIIGGNFTTYNGTARSRIARLNTDGTLDTNFNPGSGANATVSTTSIQSDDKIIIGGSFTTYNGTSRNYIARLNTDGTLDTNFNPGSGANATVSTTTIQSDNKIIIGGSFTTYNNTPAAYITRILATSNPIVVPTLTTSPVTASTSTSATGNANLTSTGGENPTRGIQWGGSLWHLHLFLFRRNRLHRNILMQPHQPHSRYDLLCPSHRYQLCWHH